MAPPEQPQSQSQSHLQPQPQTQQQPQPPQANVPVHSKTKIELLVDEELKRYNNILSAELADFQRVENALFSQFMKADTAAGRTGDKIPCIPGTNPPQPSLLLHNLGAAEQKDSESYAYIETHKWSGPTAFYGTSGAGKTRLLLEYLCHVKGLYLVAQPEIPIYEPGSEDLDSAFQDLLLVRGTKEEKEMSGLVNLATLRERLMVILYVRYAVHQHVVEHFGRDISAKEWLLMQLYPKHFFGNDIFYEILIQCIVLIDGEPDDRRVSAGKLAFLSFLRTQFKWGAVVVDESQYLLRNHKVHFVGDDDVTIQRSGFSSLLKAFVAIIKNHCLCGQFKRMPYPTFSGTGFSVEEYKREATSSFMKRCKAKVNPPFIDFQPLAPMEVISYLSRFLDLENVTEALKMHVANWIRGRPRLTATFLEEYLARPLKEETPSPEDLTRGQFHTDEDTVMIRALDEYRLDTTTRGRRASWHSGGTTAFRALEKSWLTGKVCSSLKQAVCKFTLGGKPFIFTGDMMDLMQVGVVSLSIQGSKPTEYYFEAIIDEPMIGEAGINYFGMEKLVNFSMTCQEDDGLGQSFEKVAIPYIRKNLASDAHGFFPHDSFDQYRISKISSYGVMAKKCNINETLDWIEKAINATIEGSVPPFCLPDNAFGPDAMTLMFNSAYTTFRTALVQSKFSTDVSQPAALRTIVPDWLYLQNRDETPKRSKMLSDDQWTRFEGLKQRLVGDPVLRCLVEYPAAATSTSITRGSKHRTSFAPCAVPKGTCNDIHDWQITYDGEENENLFSRKTMELLELHKGVAKKRKTGAPAQKANAKSQKKEVE